MNSRLVNAKHIVLFDDYIPIIISSLLSAILAVAIYRYGEKPKEIIINETIPARYTNFKDDPLVELPARTFISASPTDFTAAAGAVTPAVVNIKAIQGSSYDFFSSSAFGTSTGSGVIITADGYIVTNNHVIEEGDQIEVTLNDKRDFCDDPMITTKPQCWSECCNT